MINSPFLAPTAKIALIRSGPEHTCHIVHLATCVQTPKHQSHRAVGQPGLLATKANSPSTPQHWQADLSKKCMKHLCLGDAEVSADTVLALPRRPNLGLPGLGVCCWLFWQHHTLLAEDSQTTFILTTTRGQESQSQTLLIYTRKAKPLCLDASVSVFNQQCATFFLADISTRKKFQTEKYAETAMNQSLNRVGLQKYYGLLRNYSDATSLSLQISICTLPSDKADLRTATA